MQKKSSLTDSSCKGRTKPAHKSRRNTRMKTEIPTKKEKVSIIILSSAIILIFLFLGMRDNSIHNEDLSTIKVTLKETPKYYVYKIKSTTYRDIILTTQEYDKEFKITGMTFDATAHRSFKENVFAGDVLFLKVNSEDVDKLNNNTFVNNYNEVYGLTKKGINYIHLDLRTKLKNKDSKGAYLFVLLGLVMLPYGFIKGKPKISMTYAVLIICVVGLIAMFVLRKMHN
jgi:hypothetical protein